MANIYTDIAMFDAEYYLANNPDLVAAGYTVANAGEHYVEYGANEGRMPNTWFDADFYQAQNPDLAAAGLSKSDLLKHFAQYGAFEGRNPSPVFGEGQSINAQLYLEYALANADLLEAFGIAADATRLTDEQQANIANHFFVYGVTEDRAGGIADFVTSDEVKLTKALADYSAKQKAQADAEKAFEDAEEAQVEAYKAFAEEKGIDLESTEEAGSLKDGIQTKLGDELSTATTELVGFESAGGEGVVPAAFTNASAADQQQMLDTAANVLSADIAAAQKDLDALPDASKLKALDAANQAYLAAVEKAVAAEEAFAKAGGHYDVESASAETVELDFNLESGYTLKVDGSVIAKENEGKLVATNAKVEGEVSSSVPGFDQLLAAAQAAIDAVKAVESAGDKVEAALEAVAAAGTFTPAIGDDGLLVEDLAAIGVKFEPGSELEALHAAKDNKADFDELAAKWKAAAADKAEFEALVKAEDAKVEAATEAVGDAEDAADEAKDVFEDLGYNLVDADNDSTAYDEDDAEQLPDLFVFSTDLSEVENFDGNDLFYFGEAAAGKAFTFKAVEKVENIKAESDVNAFEIFAVEDAGTTTLYVESKAFAGNSANSVENNDDLVTITLTGVSVDDLQFEDGFLSFVA